MTTKKERGLTPKQKRFVEVYDGNATGAALLAGYSAKTAKAQGSRMLTNVDIWDAIQTREQQESRERVALRQQRQEFWTEIMNDPGADMKDRLRASELLGRSEGDFLNRVDLGGDTELTIKWVLPEIEQCPV